MTTPYSEGSPDAAICFVGEAPAKWEMIKRRPFVGQAGKVLDELLHSAGLIRREVAITNVCTEPIDSSKSLVSDKGALTPAGRDAAEGLRSRLDSSQHKVLVPLGNLALAALTGQYGITRWRGSPLKSTLLRGRKVIPTIHPAATLPGRGPYVQRYTIINDLKKATRHAERPDYFGPERTLQIHPTFDEAIGYLHDLREHKLFAFDIEVYNFQVSCISFAHSPHYAMSIPFVGDPWDEEQEALIWAAIARLLGDKTCTAVAHNAMFDVSFLLHTNRIRTRAKIECTMVLHRVLFPDFPAKLEFLTSVYTDEPYYKDDKQLWSRPHADPDTFYRYNCKDSATTIECYPPLHADVMKDIDFRWTYENSMSMTEPCLYMMERGVALNLDRLQTVKEDVAAELAGKETELESVAEINFNPGSSIQCQKYFYGIKGIKPYINRKTSRPTCDDKALARIVRKYNLPEARLTQEIRGLRKLRDTYLNLEYDKDGRLRTSYDVRGTKSGRLSSKKTIFGTGLNMQNLDPRFKGFIVPDDGEGGADIEVPDHH